MRILIGISIALMGVLELVLGLQHDSLFVCAMGLVLGFFGAFMLGISDKDAVRGTLWFTGGCGFFLLFLFVIWMSDGIVAINPYTLGWVTGVVFALVAIYGLIRRWFLPRASIGTDEEPVDSRTSESSRRTVSPPTDSAVSRHRDSSTLAALVCVLLGGGGLVLVIGNVLSTGQLVTGEGAFAVGQLAGAAFASIMLFAGLITLAGLRLESGAGKWADADERAAANRLKNSQARNSPCAPAGDRRPAAAADPMRTCAQCGARVWPKSDGTCPACQGRILA